MIVRRSALVVGTVVVVIAVLAALTYRRQVTAFLTHWKGAPAHTTAYEPLDPSGLQLRLAVAGDVGDSGGELDATAAAIASINGDRHPFDELLLLGDNVYPAGDPAQLPETVFGPFGPLLDTGTELLAILGNHDVPNGAAQLAALGMPTRWWSVERGDVLIIGLDSNELDNAQQLSWLETTLRASSARWRIVALHHPPYSAGYQGSNLRAREIFTPIFERYGVQLVLAGHDHDYQRSDTIRGVTYVVTGAGAGSRRTGSESFTAESFATLGFVELGVYPDRLVIRSVDHELRVGDVFELDRTADGTPT